MRQCQREIVKCIAYIWQILLLFQCKYLGHIRILGHKEGQEQESVSHFCSLCLVISHNQMWFPVLPLKGRCGLGQREIERREMGKGERREVWETVGASLCMLKQPHLVYVCVSLNQTTGYISKVFSRCKDYYIFHPPFQVIV